MKALRFIIYGLIGWCIEIFWTGAGSLFSGDYSLSGYSSLWMFLIYGSVVFFEPIVDAVCTHSLWARGFIYVTLIFAVEFFSGYLLRRLVGSCPWNYSQARFNIQGLIRLDYAPAWIIAGFAFEKLYLLLKRLRLDPRDT